MTADLPTWAASIAPLDMAGAAVVLGISRRTLVDVIRDCPQYERRGSRKVFYPEHIEELRRWLASGSSSEAKSGTPMEPLLAIVYAKALALATAGKPKNYARSSKRAPGNVVIMAKRPSGHSTRRP